MEQETLEASDNDGQASSEMDETMTEDDEDEVSLVSCDNEYVDNPNKNRDDNYMNITSENTTYACI